MKALSLFNEILNFKGLFRVADYADFKDLKSDRIVDSSYKNVAFPLGCSHSEFQMNLDEREISLLDKTGIVIGFARIKTIMFTHIYLDYFCIQDREACSRSLAELQNYLIDSYDAKKFFIQLLEHEVLEQKSLEENKFKREASLSQHIWLNGRYKDLYIYGSSLYV